MGSKYHNNSMFSYGEVSDRLIGLRASEVYQNGANQITNFEITEIGTLKVAKQYDKTANHFTGNIIATQDTNKGVYLVLQDDNKLVTVNKSSGAVETVTSVTVNSNSVLSVFDENIFVDNKWFILNDDFSVSTSTLKDNIMLPFKDKKEMKINLYKVVEVTVGTQTDTRLSLLKNYDKIKIESDGAKITIADTAITIDRLYTQYKSIPTVEDFTGLTKGQYVAVFKDYIVPKGAKKYYIGNTQVNFGTLHADTTYGSGYYTDCSTATEGDLVNGEQIDFRSDIVDVCVFQSRLVIATNEKLFFSKVLEYNDFVNGTDKEVGFYIKPTPINGNTAEIKKLTPGNGIWVSTDRGIYSVGYNLAMSPSTSIASVKIATDIPANTTSEIINDIYYYVDNKNILRSIEPNFETGVLTFVKSAIEKYAVDREVSSIAKTRHEGEERLVATPLRDSTKIYLYDRIDKDMYRRVGYELENHGDVFSLGEFLFVGKDLYVRTNRNCKRATLTMNPPNIAGKGNNTVLMDYDSRYEQLVLSALNSGIEYVYFEGKRLNNLSSAPQQEFSIYKYDCNLPVNNGFTMEIETSMDNKPVEIRMLSAKVKSNSAT